MLQERKRYYEVIKHRIEIHSIFEEFMSVESVVWARCFICTSSVRVELTEFNKKQTRVVNTTVVVVKVRTGKVI